MHVWWMEPRVPDDIQERISTCEQVIDISRHYNIDPMLSLSTAYGEGRFNAHAVNSRTGARGTMQVMPFWKCRGWQHETCNYTATAMRVLRRSLDISLHSCGGQPFVILREPLTCASFNSFTSFYYHEGLTRYARGPHMTEAISPASIRRLERVKQFYDLRDKLTQRYHRPLYVAINSYIVFSTFI
jgi:hypothetical protein